MTRIATGTGRPYSSQLRAQQADETRSRILDATIRVMAAGVGTLSIPDVAREAGVSVPTVYRHFGTKAALLAAVHPHLGRRAGIGEVVEPTSLDEFREMVRTVFSRLESLGEEARLAMSTPAADDARRSQMPQRYAMSRRFAATVMPALDEADRDRLARVLIVLASSGAMRTWRDHLGLSVDVAAEDIHWLLRTLTAPASKRKNR
jgi:AcrR family transcriptional regulator